MLDNTPERDDPGVDMDSAKGVAEMLIGTRLTINAVIESAYGWEPLPDLIAAVKTFVCACKDCGLWIQADYERCGSCAKKHGRFLVPGPYELDGDDQKFLESVGVKP